MKELLFEVVKSIGSVVLVVFKEVSKLIRKYVKQSL